MFQKGKDNIAKLPRIRKKISKALKGRKFTREWIKKLSESHKGHKVSIETRKKLSQRIGIGKWMKGRKLSEATKEKIKKNHKGMLGRKHTEEARKKMSKSHKGKSHPWNQGKNNPNWKGGKQREKHNGDWRYIKWRKSVFIRDDFTCQTCKKVGGYLEAHHIKSWAKYPKLRYDVQNGITLCKECHKSITNLKKKYANKK